MAEVSTQQVAIAIAAILLKDYEEYGTTWATREGLISSVEEQFGWKSERDWQGGRLARRRVAYGLRLLDRDEVIARGEKVIYLMEPLVAYVWLQRARREILITELLAEGAPQSSD